MKNLESIIREFSIEGEVLSVAPLGNGLINDTYRVTTSSGHPDYVLQRINHNIFKNIDGMQNNIEAVTSHIRRKLTEKSTVDIERKVLRFIKTRTTDKTYIHKDEDFWRMSVLIPDTVTLEQVTEQTARHAGLTFGEFQSMLADIEKPLIESIPDFHNMEFRLTQLHEAMENDPVGRLQEVKDLTDMIEEEAGVMTEPERMYRAGNLPKRICHCDTKVNNMLFDRDGNVLCVIDLDTVMPSFVFSDYADFLRTAACTAPEDEPDLSKIGFRMDIFKAFTDGYLTSARSFLTENEVGWLGKSIALFPYMQAVRFLTDYIIGDTYYKITYPGHNLVRTRAQLKLYESVKELLPEINAFIASCSKDKEAV